MISKEILENYFRVSDITGVKASLEGLNGYMEDVKSYKGYVVVRPARMEYIEPSDFGVRFIGNAGLGYHVKDVIEALLEIKYDHQLKDLIANVEDSKGMVEELEEYFEDHLEMYGSLEELKEDMEYEMIEFYLDNGYEDKLISDNGCYLDSVGYSQWSDFIADKRVSKSFVRDMWEGWNWYNIKEFDLEGNEFDDFGDNHFYDNEEIEDVIVNEFGLKGYKIITIDEY